MDYILPPKTSDLMFTETVKVLTELLSPKISLFHKRWERLNLTKKDDEDYLTFSSVVNKHWDEFKPADLWVPMILSASFLSRDFSQQKTPKSDEEF